MRVPGVGRLLPGCRASGVGRSATPDCPPSGRAAGAHYPLAVGAGGRGRRDPSPTPQRALLRVGFARCGGGTRAPRGDASCLGVGRPGSGALPPPTARPLGGLPRPTTHWLWVREMRASGPVTNTTAHSLACCGGGMRMPGGGASWLSVWRPVSGALPIPTARPLGGLPGPTTHSLWVRGGAGVGTRHQPHSARSCVLWGRHEDARGGRLLAECVASGVGRSPDPDCPPSGRAAGAHHPHAVGAGGCGREDPSPTPSARALASWLCALWGWHEGAGGGALLPGCGASGVGRSPNPDCPPSGRAAGAHGPLAVGAGGCGRGEPSPTPQRTLLRAVGAARGRPGGAPPASVWCVRGRALSHPRLPALWAGSRGPLPTCCGCRGVRAWGPVTKPTAHSLACCRGGMRVRRGGASCLGVGRPGSGALPPPTARPLGGLPGPTTHWLWVRGGAGVGTRHQPHSARYCELALRPVGAGRGRPGGAPPAWVWGVGVGRSPTPDPLPSWRAAGAHYPLAVGAGGCGRGDPSPTPQRALSRAGFARCRGGMRAPGGGASCLGVGRPWSGALPPPTARPLGGQPGPTTHWLWVRGGAGVGTRLQPHSARCVGGTRAPGGGASCLGVGRPGSGALPPSTAPPLGGPPGPTIHWLWVWGGAGVGTRHQPHSARCGGGTMAPGGGAPPAWVWGVRGRALSHSRLPTLWAGCRGPLPTGCGCGGVRAWGPVTNPTARASASWLCALWGRHEGARGRRLLPGCGASGVGRSPTPDCPPSGRAAGAHYPLAVAAGGCGPGDPSPNLLRPLLRAVGGGMRVPRGGASCLGVGRPGSGALPPPTARPLGGLPGLTTHWLWLRGVAGVGTRHQPHSARSCELALRAVGAGRGRPGGAPRAWAWGVRGWALSHPRLPALWAGCRGPLPTGCGCGGVRAWGPVTDPTARALASWLCALWGRHEGARGGRLLPGCGASVVGRSPTPDCPPSGRAAGAHYPLVVGSGGCGRGDSSPTPQRALLRARFARCGGGMRLPGGGASCLGVGRPGSVALQPPPARPLGGLPGPSTHWLWVRRGAGMGTRLQLHSARSCVLWGRHEGARGGCLLPGCGASGVGRSPTPDCPPSGRAAGAHYRLAVGVGGCGRGDLSPTTQRALWGRHEGARGGRLLPGCGASRVRCSPTPYCPRSGRAAGAHYPLAVGAGVGTHHQPDCARSCALWGRHEGARGGRLLPGCGASGVGRSPTPDCPPSGRSASACVRVRALLGWVGRAGLPGAFWCASSFLWPFCPSSLFGPLRAGVALFVVVVGFFFLFFLFPFSFSPSLRPRCVLLCVFSGPWCLGPQRRSLPGPAPAVPLPPVTPADLLLISACIPQNPGSKIEKNRK